MKIGEIRELRWLGIERKIHFVPHHKKKICTKFERDGHFMDGR